MRSAFAEEFETPVASAGRRGRALRLADAHRQQGKDITRILGRLSQCADNAGVAIFEDRALIKDAQYVHLR